MSGRRLLLGAHMSVAGGLHRAFDHAREAGCDALQIFTKNANRWEGKPLDDEAVAAFRSAWEHSGIGPVLAHDSYLINLASPEKEKWQRSMDAFVDEMSRCHLLGISALVMHPGAHMGQGVDAGLARVAEAFDRILQRAPEDVTVLIENTAGQGSYLGGAFEELAQLLGGLPESRFGVCFDTCHAFAAGHPLATAEDVEATLERFDRLIGLSRIGAFHLNDSLKGLGSGVDRHAHIGQGAIGNAGFQALLAQPRFDGIPKILETPKGENLAMDKKNLAKLRSLAPGEPS